MPVKFRASGSDRCSKQDSMLLFREKGVVPVVDRKRSNHMEQRRTDLESVFFTDSDLKNFCGVEMKPLDPVQSTTGSQQTPSSCASCCRAFFLSFRHRGEQIAPWHGPTQALLCLSGPGWRTRTLRPPAVQPSSFRPGAGELSESLTTNAARR
jgi:hypothetical protein